MKVFKPIIILCIIIAVIVIIGSIFADSDANKTPQSGEMVASSSKQAEPSATQAPVKESIPESEAVFVGESTPVPEVKVDPLAFLDIPVYELNEADSAPYVQVTTFWADDSPYTTLYSEWRCDLDAENTYYNVFSFYEPDTPGSGYAGFQNVNGGHIAIFSMWDAPGCRPTVEYCMEGGRSVDFGNEGTGASVRVPFNWEEGQWYAMLIDCESRNGKTYYTCYVQPLGGVWVVIGQISFPVEGLGIHSNTFFLEDFTFNGLERGESIRNILAVKDGSSVTPPMLAAYHYDSKYFHVANSSLRCTISQPEPGMISIRSAGWDIADKQAFPATLQY